MGNGMINGRQHTPVEVEKRLEISRFGKTDCARDGQKL